GVEPWFLLSRAARCLARVGLSCPPGWTQFGSRCLIFYYNMKTWSDAEVQSHANTTHCFIQSAGEIQAWIGLYRNSWMWVDGSNSSFRHWRASEPNGSEENCRKQSQKYKPNGVLCVS
uniref:C-type lectin domain-containing protein n=1 Tax=Xiphophorus maculatus TaxID=8083 RepID=A0A3B5PW00_XIPMA